MNKKHIIYGLLILLLGMCASAEVTINQSSVSITQYIGTSATYSLTLTNTNVNDSESVNVQLTGGEILDLTSDFPKTISIPANSSRTLLFTITIPSTETAHTVSGYLSFYYTGQQNIPISVNIQSAATTTTTTTTTTTSTTTTTINPQPAPNILKFLSSIYSNSFMQGTTTTEDFYIKNYGTCACAVFGVQYDGTITFPGGIRRPIRQTGTLPSSLASGERSKVTVTIDTNGLSVDTYKVTLWIQGEDCAGNPLQDSMTFSISVVEGAQPANDTTEGIQLTLYDYESTGTMRVVAKIDGDRTENVKMKLYLDGDFLDTQYTDSNGEAEFSLEDKGDYKIVASRSGYSNKEKEFTVESSSTELSVSIGSASINQAMTIAVNAGTKNISGATVKITYPNGNYDTMQTSSSGIITIIPTQIGVYNLIVSKSGYSSTTKTFSVEYMPLDIAISGSQVVNGQVTLTLTSNGTAIGGVAVVITNSNSSSTSLVTSSSGTIQFTFGSAGTYTIIANKTGYVGASKTVTIAAMALTIVPEGVSGTTIPIGNNVILRTKYGDTIVGTVSLELTLPDNTIAALTTSDTGAVSYKFEKVGTYKILAKKIGYLDASSTLTVVRNKMFLSITYYNSNNQAVAGPEYGGSMTVKVTDADGKEISGLMLTITPPNGQLVESPTISFTDEGNYKIQAVKQDYDDEIKTVSVPIPVSCTVDIKQKYANEPFTITCSPAKQTTLSMVCAGVSKQITTNNDGTLQYTLPDAATCYLQYSGKNSPEFQVAAQFNLGGDWWIYGIVVFLIILILYTVFRKGKNTRTSKPDTGSYDNSIEKDYETTQLGG